MTRWAILIVAVGLLHTRPLTAQDPEETRDPFQVEVSFNVETIVGTGERTIPVPKDTRLVIETVSAWCITTSTQLVSTLRVAAVAKNHLTQVQSTTSHFFPMVAQGRLIASQGPTYQWVASSPTHIYADGGTLVTVAARTSAGDPAACWATLGGFLVKPAPAP